MPDEPIHTPPDDEVSEGSLLSNILNLLEPENKDVRPPEDKPPAEKPEDKPAPEKPEDKPPVDANADPTLDALADPKPEDKPKKKVVVRKHEPLTKEDLAGAFKQALTESREPTKEDRKPEPEKVDVDLTPEEQEELDLVAFAEKSDKNLSGLSDRFRRFYAEQKKFLEKRVDEEGPEYDPASDPQFRKFLEKHQPVFSQADRKRFSTQRITEEAEARAAAKVRKELSPELEATKQKLLEMEVAPRINQRLQKYLDEVSTGMPKEIVEFFTANGYDAVKAREAFPLEFEIVEREVGAALRQAQEFLQVRSGVRAMDMANPVHKRLHDFVDQKARNFLASGKNLVRGGKTFVHPYEWSPDKAATGWTFEDEDVLNLLKMQAQFNARARIDAEQKRVDAIAKARAARAAAQNGATVTQVEVPEDKSPKLASAPAPGAAETVPDSETGLLTGILGFGTK